jgi:hypothetical protein
VAAQQVADDPAVALRSELERLLGAHVLLADEVVRGQLLGREDVVRASSESIGRNTDELVEAVTSLAGPEIGEQFRTTWERHVEVLGQYATALEEDDEAGSAGGQGRLRQGEAELATALSAVVGGRSRRPTSPRPRRRTAEHLLEQADAYAAKDYAKAAGHPAGRLRAHDRDGRRAGPRGRAAKGLPTTELDTPRRDLHSALSRLLAEHMGLMVQVLRATQDEAPDLAAAGERSTPTRRPRRCDSDPVRAGGEHAVPRAVASHIEGLIQVAEHRGPAEQEAGPRRRSSTPPSSPASWPAAVEGRLPAIDLAAALTIHDDHLLAWPTPTPRRTTRSPSSRPTRLRPHDRLASTLAVAIGTPRRRSCRRVEPPPAAAARPTGTGDGRARAGASGRRRARRRRA